MASDSNLASIVYISIGNSDDKLTQKRWAEFINAVGVALLAARVKFHGTWFSAPQATWQNACWCVEFMPDATMADTIRLQRILANIAHSFEQDSISWAWVSDQNFIQAMPMQSGPDWDAIRVVPSCPSCKSYVRKGQSCWDPWHDG